MRSVVLERPSIAALLHIIENQPGAYHHLFRGHSDATWGLVPSLYRQKPNIHGVTSAQSFSLYEAQALELFFREALPYLPPLERNYANDRIIAQHFGVPTRLLDWSRDPLVATFFAVENWRSGSDAAVYMLLADGIYTEGSAITAPETYQAVRLRPPAIDRRIPAQKSVFTLHSFGTVEGDAFVPLQDRPNMGNLVTDNDGKPVHGFAKITIPATHCQILHHTLLEMGIDRRNLFPGLDGVGADLAIRSSMGMLW